MIPKESDMMEASLPHTQQNCWDEEQLFAGNHSVQVISAAQS